MVPLVWNRMSLMTLHAICAVLHIAAVALHSATQAFNDEISYYGVHFSRFCAFGEANLLHTLSFNCWQHRGGQRLTVTLMHHSAGIWFCLLLA